MVTKNKIPANWPDGLAMADEIAELIQEFRWRHKDGLPCLDSEKDASEVLGRIAKLVGMNNERRAGGGAQGGEGQEDPAR